MEAAKRAIKKAQAERECVEGKAAADKAKAARLVEVERAARKESAEEKLRVAATELTTQ